MGKSVEDLKKRGASLFAAKRSLDTLWQEQAEIFYVERADFLIDRSLGDEFADHLGSSETLLLRRDLANSFAGLLRRDNWFEMSVEQPDRVDMAGKHYLAWATKRLRQFMYDRDASMKRATKSCDHDFATFGNTVMHVDIRKHLDGLIFRDHHLRDMAWAEDENGKINEVHRNWKPTVSQLCSLFDKENAQFGVHRDVKQMLADHPHKVVNCRQAVMPADDYGHKWEAEGYNPVKFVSCIIDVDHDHKMTEVPLVTFPYVIPRWHLIRESQYAYSPATVAALPDARSFQAVILTLLEAGEKYVNPPLIGVREAMRSDMDVRAGGFTAIAAKYDERLGDVLRPLTQDRSGMPIGFEIAEQLKVTLQKAFFLDQIDIPPLDSKEMTAFEFGERMRQYARKVLPLFEPVEDEYSAPMCEVAFDILYRHGAFGPDEQIPESILDQDVSFKFTSPLREAAEKARAGNLGEMIQVLQTVLPLDPTLIAHANLEKATRDTLEAVVEDEWIHTEDMAAETIDRIRQQMEQQRMMEAAQQGGDAAQAVGDGVGAVQEQVAA